MDVTVPTDGLALQDPGNGIPVSDTAQLNIPINGKGGKLYGVELATTLPFDTFTSALDGFGVTGSVAYTKTKIAVRYRSTFIGEVSGFSANRVRRRAASETIVDAQIGYDFQPDSTLAGLSLYIQGQNLTDAPFITTNPGDSRQIIDYQTYGRRFLAGFTYKF